MFIFSMSSLMFLSQIFLGVGYIQSSNLFPEPLTQEEEKEYLKISCTYCKKILFNKC